MSDIRKEVREQEGHHVIRLYQHIRLPVLVQQQTSNKMLIKMDLLESRNSAII